MVVKPHHRLTPPPSRGYPGKHNTLFGKCTLLGGVIISNLLLTKNDKWGGGSSFAPAKMVNARGGIVIRGGGGFKMTLV